MVTISAVGLQAWCDDRYEDVASPVNGSEDDVTGDVASSDGDVTASAADGTDGIDGAGSPAKRRRFHIPKFLRRGVVLIVLVLVFEYFVLPELTLARNSVTSLSHVNPFLLVLAFAAEVASLFAYAKLTVVVLPPNSLSLSKAWRINLASLSVSHTVPGGTAGGTGLSILVMTNEGISVTDVGFATATQGIGSAVLLNVMLWLALVISIPINGFNTIYVSVAIVSVLLVGLFAALVAGFMSGEGWAVKALRRLARRFRFIPEDKVERSVRQIADRLHALARNPTLIRRGLLWAALNWLLDATCLYVCLLALHHVVDPIDVIVAYGVGNVLAAIPITPGGLGTVEFFVPLLLHGFGVPVGIAGLAVLGWRLFNFWLPIPVGAACYMSLRVGRGASMRERQRALKAMGEIARRPRDGPDPKTSPVVPEAG
jgi:hypothetical protein